uniref:Uncharacterized protein n=1 Tax=Marmota marmota marmota TaxID=9994 RepID=A0A8C6EPN5_MARMA
MEDISCVQPIRWPESPRCWAGQTHGDSTHRYMEFMDNTVSSLIWNSKAHPESDVLTLLESEEARKLS